MHNDIIKLGTESSIRQLFFGSPKTREDILSIESAIKSMETSFDECPYPLYHYLDNGMYVREIHMDAGHLVCSKIHKDDYFVTMLSGKCWVINEYESRELIAPCAFRVKGGAKNILYILEPTVWIDTHTVESSTVPEAEKEIFSQSYEDYDKYKKTIKADYTGEIGIMPTTKIEQPDCDYVEIVEGKGVFLTENVKKGEAIGLVKLMNTKTPAGETINYSDNPTAELLKRNDMEILIAYTDLEKGVELCLAG